MTLVSSAGCSFTVFRRASLRGFLGLSGDRGIRAAHAFESAADEFARAGDAFDSGWGREEALRREVHPDLAPERRDS